MTSQWPDNYDANTWQVISNSLDIDFIHGNIHGRSCKTTSTRGDLVYWREYESPVAPFTYTEHSMNESVIHYKVWDEITYPFLNFNGATVEVQGLKSNRASKTGDRPQYAIAILKFPDEHISM